MKIAPAKLLQIELIEHGIASVLEHQFHPHRKWRFDLALVGRKIAVEVDGGNFIRGAHARGAGQRRDRQKTNAAILLGWTVLRYDPQEVNRGDALADILRLVNP